jgi:hypothetical protein
MLLPLLRTGEGARDACLGTSRTLVVDSSVAVRGKRLGRISFVEIESLPPADVNLHALLLERWHCQSTDRRRGSDDIDA